MMLICQEQQRPLKDALSTFSQETGLGEKALLLTLPWVCLVWLRKPLWGPGVAFPLLY